MRASGVAVAGLMGYMLESGPGMCVCACVRACVCARGVALADLMGYMLESDPGMCVCTLGGRRFA